MKEPQKMYLQKKKIHYNKNKPMNYKFKLDGTPTLRYQRSQEYQEEEHKIKSAHREIIFGDSPDITLNPQLPTIGEPQT